MPILMMALLALIDLWSDWDSADRRDDPGALASTHMPSKVMLHPCDLRRCPLP